MNLLTDKWIPVIRENGPDKIAPWQIVETENPVMEINAPRPDFQGALYQFFIGLLQTCFAPEDEDQWRQYWGQMPKPGELKKVFGNEDLTRAFDLNFQNGFGFMQDRDDFEGDWLPVEDLIGGALSGNTRKEHKDLFVKTKQVETVSPYWAALALFNVQVTGVLAWGKHRVGLRGNAPLTTLIMPISKQSLLWKKLWLNVIYMEDLDLIPGDSNKKGSGDIFPWMTATRKSPNKEPTSPMDANPLQHFWAMPRRIRLKIEPVKCKCELSGEDIEYGVRFYKRIPDGVYYTNGWIHPLTPYTRLTKDRFPKPISGEYAGEGFRQWVSLNYDEHTDEENNQMRWGRALVVKHYYDEKKYQIDIGTKLWCFGYDATNANVKCWYESVIPTLNVASDKIDALKSNVSDALQVAYQLNDELRFACIRAWFKPQTDSSGKQKWNHITSAVKKNGHLSSYKSIDYEFWESLEKTFSILLDGLIAYGNEPGRPLEIYSLWAKAIQNQCLRYFNENALAIAEDKVDMKRVIEARNYLFSVLYPKKNCLLKNINEHSKQKEVAA